MRGRGRLHPNDSFNPPPPTPSIGCPRNSDASVASSRPSSAGIGRSLVPIEDPSYQQAAIRTINTYLNSHNFHPTLKPSILPSAKDITSIFTFLISQFDCPNPKFEDYLPPLLQFLNCPYQIPKSAFRAPATPHAWPNFLAVMHWLVQLAPYTQHASSSSSTASFMDNNTMKAYELESHVEALDNELLGKLGKSRDEMEESVKDLEKTLVEIEARLEALRNGPSEREIKGKEQSALEEDVNKFNTMTGMIIRDYRRRRRN